MATMKEDIKNFFNDVGTWIDDKIIQPIGNIFDGKAAEKIAKKGNELLKPIKPIVDNISEGIINNFPLATEEDKQNMKEMLKPEMLREEETEATGNTQETNTQSIKELWEREDAIRKETQQREDTAYQRAVEDMRKAGINPNLVGVNQANSGGGIINATGQNLLSTEMSGIVNQAIAEINNTVKADENQKDRISDIIKTLAMFMLLKK